MLDALRQILYPREFRIGPPVWPEETLRNFEAIATSLESLTKQAATEVKDESNQLIAEVGTWLWRLGQDLSGLGKEGSSGELRHLSRRLEAAWDALTQNGIKVQDHTGEVYDGGMSVRVLAFEPVPGLGREQIIETVTPTIYRGDRLVQYGEVIVGRPAEEAP